MVLSILPLPPACHCLNMNLQILMFIKPSASFHCSFPVGKSSLSKSFLFNCVSSKYSTRITETCINVFEIFQPRERVIPSGLKSSFSLPLLSNGLYNGITCHKEWFKAHVQKFTSTAPCLHFLFF